MKLEIREIKDRGMPNERIVLDVKEDCDLGYYFVFNTKRLPENSISSSIRNPYWLPSKQVKKGDLVVIYTKVGSSSFKINNDKTTSHFYYRDFTTPILINEDIVLVVEAIYWKAETF
jgi:hypothetical protein